MSTATSEARITVVGTPGLLSVNIVADCVANPSAPDVDSLAQVTSLREGDITWVEARWTIT
jgi:hypothetical protein